jgi:NAD(P)H-hydrate repair Nnr-like enzyme with NAD(P)H-hydrate epimerase domain
MSSYCRLAAVLSLAVAAVLVVGCGETVIDAAKTEDAIEQNLQKSTGQKISSVDCPSGVEVERGATFECEVSLAEGKQEIVSLKILNDDADVAVTDVKFDEGAKKDE